MKLKNKILLFCMIFAANTAFCQQAISFSRVKIIPTQQRITSPDFFYKRTGTINILPGNFYTTQLGFFCRQELKLESATKIPLKFRLGSVQYCDRMEGKKNAGIIAAW